MRGNTWVWGWILLAAASCQTAQPIGVDARDAGASVLSTSLVFRQVFPSGAGTDLRAMTVGPADDIWIAGRFFTSLQIGETTLTSAGPSDVFVARLDRMGNPRWTARVGGCAGLAVDADGNAIVAYQGLAARAGVTGEIIWKNRGLPLAESWPIELAVDREGNAIIGEGRTVSPDIGLQKVSASGVIQFKKRFRGHGDGGNFSGVSADPQGNIVISGAGGVELGGWTRPENGGAPWIGKLDPSGNRIWQVFGVEGRVAADDAGNVLYANADSVGKLDPQGGWIWKHAARIDGEVGAVATDSTGRVIYAGSFQGRVDFGDGLVDSGEHAALFVAAIAP